MLQKSIASRQTVFNQIAHSIRHIATTFLAAAYARMIFPCYDEPQLKAKFSIHISHAAKYHALSNSPILSQSQSE